MTVVVGYIPDQYGEAALAAGIEEAERRGTDLVIVNATKGDALVDRRYVGEAAMAELEERLSGVSSNLDSRLFLGPENILDILHDVTMNNVLHFLPSLTLDSVLYFADSRLYTLLSARPAIDLDTKRRSRYASRNITDV